MGGFVIAAGYNMSHVGPLSACVYTCALVLHYHVS